ncbi:MAG: slipin family protein, partial [Erysipelotrichaceae bacterium]|nr:slipin family protein [Erysipelotrichaceae bacterium]
MKKYVIQKSEMGLVFKNEVLRRIVTKVKTYRFLQAEMLIINKKDYLPLKEMTVAELESLKENDLSVDYLIPTGFQGILYVDGVFKEMLESGRHWFITVDKKVEVKTIDVRKRTIHVNAQEILTTDKIDLRVNFAVSFNVVDAKKALTEYDKFDDALYLLCQLVIREYISSKTMDEILEEKASLGEKLLAILRPKEKEYGIAFIDAGLKDVILPGDIKAILNTVLVAQKQAQANV